MSESSGGERLTVDAGSSEDFPDVTLRNVTYHYGTVGLSHATPLHTPIPGTLNDLHSFDTAALVWRRIAAASPPEPRCGAGLAALGRMLFVFGGARQPENVAGEHPPPALC